jgi:hypothetical protein
MRLTDKHPRTIDAGMFMEVRINYKDGTESQRRGRPRRINFTRYTPYKIATEEGKIRDAIVKKVLPIFKKVQSINVKYTTISVAFATSLSKSFNNRIGFTIQESGMVPGEFTPNKPFVVALRHNNSNTFYKLELYGVPDTDPTTDPDYGRKQEERKAIPNFFIEPTDLFPIGEGNMVTDAENDVRANLVTRARETRPNRYELNLKNTSKGDPNTAYARGLTKGARIPVSFRSELIEALILGHEEITEENPPTK